MYCDFVWRILYSKTTNKQKTTTYITYKKYIYLVCCDLEKIKKIIKNRKKKNTTQEKFLDILLLLLSAEEAQKINRDNDDNDEETGSRLKLVW